MSTRCQIAFTSAETNLDTPEALLYRHSDGYPSGVLPEMMPFLNWWAGARGINDIQYCSARLLQYLANMYDGYTIKWAKERLEKYKGDESKRSIDEIAETEKFTGTLGYGICNAYQWDIEYVYEITKEGVNVYETSYSGKGKMSEHVKHLGLIPYQDFDIDETYNNLTKE